MPERLACETADVGDLFALTWRAEMLEKAGDHESTERLRAWLLRDLDADSVPPVDG
ncbi:hypothetical protein [Embleya scabrispora]|uniref:hypothetical protein n=1 Tax=Embleya scabrispora TaxID=159449 RepID=UPI0003751E2B|nr:hypothetical protein [Embleya scabrispora]MYS86608.1 hypothetical protein [Streptomyces sp. SID5474]